MADVITLRPTRKESRGFFAPLVRAKPPVERFILSGWIDGYIIREWGKTIATFHGIENRGLAERTLKRLKEEAEAGQ